MDKNIEPADLICESLLIVQITCFHMKHFVLDLS